MPNANLKSPKRVLISLIAGVHPETGVELSTDSVLQNIDVVRTLMAALAAVEVTEARALRRAKLPNGVGRAWTKEEERQVVAAFEAGQTLHLIAERHERTLRGIEARLERLGVINASERVTTNSFSGSIAKRVESSD